MSAGQYRDFVKIITPTVVDDGSGGQIETSDPPFVTAFASIRALGSRELENAGAVQSVATHLITLAYRPGIDTKQLIEVVADGLTFEIVGIVDPDRKQRILELTCVEAD